MSVCVFRLEPLWHVPASSSRGPVGGGGQRRGGRQDVPGKESPNRHSKVRLPPSECAAGWWFRSRSDCSVFGAQGEAQYSSHSSSNTLSSNASSNHSDERWFDAAERGGPADSADPDPDPLNKGGSNDSGIDSSTPYNNNSARHGNAPSKTAHGFPGYGGLQELSVGRSSGGGDTRRRESSPIVPAAANQNKGYRTRTFPPPGSSADKMDAFKPR